MSNIIKIVALGSLLLVPLSGWADDTVSAEGECRRNPPGLRAADMIEAGYVVHRLNDGSNAYVRLDYVFPDRLYFRNGGHTWRALYLAHPSSVVQSRTNPGSGASTICGYVIGFRIGGSESASSRPTWLFIQDVDFVETP